MQILPSLNIGESAIAARPKSLAFARNDLLFTMSDNTRASFLVGSAARGFVFSRTRYCQQSTFAEATVDNLRDRDWLANRSGGAAKVGGARRDRTDDLLLAKQALSQLSYGPDCGCGSITKDARENRGGPGKI